MNGISNQPLKKGLEYIEGSADDLLVDTETENITEKVSKEKDTVKTKETFSMNEITDKLVALEIEKIGLNQLAKEKGHIDVNWPFVVIFFFFTLWLSDWSKYRTMLY